MAGSTGGLLPAGIFFLKDIKGHQKGYFLELSQ
jgi:hypothetical protein